MNLDHLAYFAEVARLQHVGRAARALAKSPSAVSHAIANLETEIGHPLFVRQGRRIFLTAHGQRLAVRADEILGSVSSTLDELRAPTIDVTGQLRLAATHGLASEWITPACARLQERHPRMAIELYSLRTADVVRAVAAREVDLGFGYNPVLPPELAFEVVHLSRLVVAARAGHPLTRLPAKQRRMRLADYPSAAPKAFSGVENCESHPIFGTWGIAPTVRFVFDSYPIAERLLIETDTWALLPQWTVLRAKTLAALVTPPQKEAPLSLAMIWSRRKPPARVARELVASLRRGPLHPPRAAP